MKPETSYEFVRDWFKRSAAKADQIGRYESAQLWRDGLEHIETLREQRDELYVALNALVGFCDDPRGSEGTESLAMGLARLLPAARAAIEKATNREHS